MNKISPLRIYKTLLDITWYSFIIFFTLFLIWNIFNLLANGHIGNSGLVTFPVKVELPQFDFGKLRNAYSFIEKEPATIMIELSKVKLNSLTDSFILTSLLATIIGFGLGLYQIKLLRDLLADVIAKQIFTSQNIKRLRLIGIIELLSIPIGCGLYLIFDYIIVNHSILDKSLSYVPDYWELFSSLPHALEYLIFAGIFSFGLKLKQEQDLTI